MLYCTWSGCGIVAWWCAVLGLVTGLAAAWAWAWSTRVPLVPLEDNPGGMMSPAPKLEALEWRVAGWRQNDRAGQRNRIAALLTAVAVVLSSAASLLSLTPTSRAEAPAHHGRSSSTCAGNISGESCPVGRSSGARVTTRLGARGVTTHAADHLVGEKSQI
ncbi:hypothetical protein [Burkholderia gladioli]|uniref:hypothetical protein n=1 Tax=Burkholderia gladioli TaxID=28095 RepID=UPI0016419051|nr:hypothetical protein [Burkholderia gladioli]MBJ9711956.1 hypothetical protein [Burkholderia gladioli]MDZ4041549.1 hypothetical protein [Burkholderia gladioli pv. alliicola]